MSNKWKKHYQKSGGLWIHNGNPGQPHALLASGRHSDTFFNSGLLTWDPMLVRQAATELVVKADIYADSNIVPNIVIGPALGAITLAHELGALLDAKTVFSEKVDDEPGVKRVMDITRVILEEGWLALCCEDVLTRGTTILATFEALKKMGVNIMPYVLVLVNRSGETEMAGCRIVSLIEECPPAWLPAECPLCKQGSKAIAPKRNDNWAMLTAGTPA